MFTFNKRTAGRFDVFASFQSAGDNHKKRFGAGVTPGNQQTINVYAKGEFRFEIGGFSQIMPEGSCTLDLELTEFPAGEISTETVLSAYGIRYCVSPNTGGAFTREVIHVVPGSPKQFQVETLVFVLHGFIEVGGVSVSQAGYTLVGPNVPVTGEAALLAVA